MKVETTTIGEAWYHSVTRHTEDQTVAPEAAAQAAIRVADLLP